MSVEDQIALLKWKKEKKKKKQQLKETSVRVDLNQTRLKSAIIQLDECKYY